MKVKLVAGLTLAGAATACVFLGASYPVAIWGAGFALIYKFTHRTEVHCPVLLAAMQAAAAEERRASESVVVGYHRARGAKSGENQRV